jgi:hypothetical protein
VKRLAVSLFLVALTAPATASAQTFEPLRPKAVAKISMAKTGLDGPAYARLDRLAKRYGRVGVKAVVESANRDVQSAAGSPSLRQIGAPVASSFKWNNGDNGVDYWIPQGITGSAAATQDGIVGGHRSLVVSWYGPNGARLTFVNADNGFTKYRHVLLVEPSGNSFKPISTHAGGVAWYGDKLYVAETKVGLRVFDTNYFLDASKSPESIDQGYRWVLPQAGLYQQNGVRRVRFSSVETDRGGPALVTGAWADKKPGRLAVRWALRGDQLTAVNAWRMPTSNVQGVLQHNNVLVASSSFDLDAGSGIGELITGAPRTPARRINWPDGAEDVHYAGTSGRTYSLTEHRGDRIVFAVDGTSVGVPR